MLSIGFKAINLGLLQNASYKRPRDKGSIDRALWEIEAEI
jgi:hypothetical protein